MPEPPWPARRGTLTLMTPTRRRRPDDEPEAPDPERRRRRTRRPADEAPPRRGRCSTLRDGLPPVIETEPALAEACRGARRRHRPGRDRRRARLRLPLLLARLPDPAAPRGRRHRSWSTRSASTPWPRCRRPSAAPSGSCTPPPRTCPAWPRSACAPAALFDTELAGRLLGYPRVGLATLVETLLGYRMNKEHSAVDWSTRPLPEPWLEYAALDVEVLVELRDALAARAGRGRQGRVGAPGVRRTCAASTPTSAREPWRRTSGLHRVRGRRALGAVRALWEARDELARQRDVTPGPDHRRRRDRRGRHGRCRRPRRRCCRTKGFHGRGAERYADRWVAALARARELPEDDLPVRAPRTDGPPTPRAWAERDPVAAQRLTLARDGMAQLSEQHRGTCREPADPRHRPPGDVGARRRGRARRQRRSCARSAPATGRSSSTAPMLADADRPPPGSPADLLADLADPLSGRSARRGPGAGAEPRSEHPERRAVDLARRPRHLGRRASQHRLQHRVDGQVELVHCSTTGG